MSPLELHYVDTVLHIQRLILRRAPKLLSRAVGLTDTEVAQIAALLAEAHTVATEAEKSTGEACVRCEQPILNDALFIGWRGPMHPTCSTREPGPREVA